MPKKINKKSNKKVAVVIAAIVAVLIGAGIALTLVLSNKPLSLTIEYASEGKSAKVTLDNGKTEDVDVPTVESIDSQSDANEDKAKEQVETGRGWWVPTDSPEAFKNAVINVCVDTDGAYGSQCWDLANLYWQNYAGRTLTTCGTGAAKGTINCWEQNAGGEFEMVWDATQLQPGDIVVFSGGQWGHIGMAMGYYNNGYVTLLGTNQGGTPCSGGGSTANIINISLRDFSGAFRPKAYIKPPAPEPAPEPEPIPITGCKDWNVVKGDTMGGIMLSCEGVIVYGEPMNQYADSWISQKANQGKSVYWGWTHGKGYGLYAGDYLLHNVGE